MLSAEDADALVERLKEDYDTYEALTALHGKTKALESKLHKSPFQLTFTQQWDAAFVCTGWVITPEVKSMDLEKSHQIMYQRAIEDFFAAAKTMDAGR